METRRVEYPISPRYIPKWTVREALRELIANALDTETDIRVDWQDGFGQIEDHSTGVPQKFWVLGEGNGGAIGQFHEGLKLAMLVFARERRMVEVDTVGYSVSPSLAYSEVYQSDVLVLDYRPNVRPLGTAITVECSEQELTEARDLFLVFNAPKVLDRDLNLFDSPGSLWINGVYVQQIDALWGYNFTDKELTNRDRSVLNMSGVKQHVGRVLHRLTSVPLMMQLLQAEKGKYIEQTLFVLVAEGSAKLWVKAFHKVFGEKACLTATLLADKKATELGWYVVKDLSDGLQYLLSNAGVPTSDDVVKKRRKTTFAWPESPLTEQESEVLAQAKKIARAVVPSTEVGQTHVVEGFPDMDGAMCVTEGLYKNGNVYLRRSCLSDLAKATGVLIHERLHGCGHDDETRQFEYAMTMLLGQLAVKADLSSLPKEEPKEK